MSNFCWICVVYHVVGLMSKKMLVKRGTYLRIAEHFLFQADAELSIFCSQVLNSSSPKASGYNFISQAAGLNWRI